MATRSLDARGPRVTLAPMFPIRDHNPSGIVPVVTWALIALNVAVQLYVSTLPDRAVWGLYGAYALVPLEVAQGRGWGTLVSSAFLHAGWLHLGGNMLFLWIFGDNVEAALGRLGFLLFYLLAAVGAGLAQVLADPLSPIPTIGASGAVAGVMGGYLLLFPRARVDLLLFLVVVVRVIPVPAWIVLAVWVGGQAVQGALVDTSGGGVAYWAHVGGFAAGLLLMVVPWLRRGGPAFWALTHGAPPHPEAAYGRLAPTRVPVVRRR